MGPHSTIQAGRDYVRANLSDGVSCPCCGQLAKMYRRTINGAMARALIGLLRLDDRQAGAVIDGQRWHYVKSLPVIQGRHGGGDFAKLRWWGLIEELPKGLDSKRRTSGMWKLTRRGRLWAEQAITVPRHALVFDGTVHSIAGDEISILDALSSQFDYAALMGRRGGHSA